MKFYEVLAEAELLCLNAQQTLKEDAPATSETRRNYLEYAGRAKMFEDLLNSACKR
jgi:hypothetical protein